MGCCVYDLCYIFVIMVFFDGIDLLILQYWMGYVLIEMMQKYFYYLGSSVDVVGFVCLNDVVDV